MTENPTFPHPTEDDWQFTKYGLHIEVEKNHPRIYEELEPDVYVARLISFYTPSGKFNIDPTVNTFTLLYGLLGLMNFFEEMDDPNLGKRKPEYFWGQTPEGPMSKIMAERLGFQIKQKGNSHVCFASTETVREKVNEIFTNRDRRGKTILEKLQSRVFPNL